MLSNASLKSKDKMQVDMLVNSACAMVSRMAESAPSMLFPCTPQYWLGCRRSLSHGRSLFAFSLDRSLKSEFINP